MPNIVPNEDFRISFAAFLNDIKENLHPSFKSAEAFLDGHMMKIRISENKIFFPKKIIVCFRPAGFEVDDEGDEIVTRWTWEEYYERYEKNESMQSFARAYFKPDDVFLDYEKRSRFYGLYYSNNEE